MFKLHFTRLIAFLLYKCLTSIVTLQASLRGTGTYSGLVTDERLADLNQRAVQLGELYEALATKLGSFSTEHLDRGNYLLSDVGSSVSYGIEQSETFLRFLQEIKNMDKGSGYDPEVAQTQVPIPSIPDDTPYRESGRGSR